MPRSPKLSLQERVSERSEVVEVPKFSCWTVLRWSKKSLRSEVLSGCVKAQTSTGSENWSSITMLGWCMIGLHEPSSLRGFVNGIPRRLCLKSWQSKRIIKVKGIIRTTENDFEKNEQNTQINRRHPMLSWLPAYMADVVSGQEGRTVERRGDAI